MPVTTRTRRAKPQTTKQSLAKEDVDGYWSSELSDPEEDTSDWEDKRRKRPSGSPQKKRARRNIAGSGSANSKVRGTTIKLSKFPTLPLDIIFEILSLLTPTDLANLAQTNTAFRSTLASPHASNVWKAARKRTGCVPDCPPNVGEVSWARFIYSAPKCQECGVSNVHHLDFALRRRVCKKCKKQKLVYVGFFAKRYPGFNPAMLELIPHTNTGSSSVGRSKVTSKFYWEADIYAMAKTYGEYQMDIYSKKPGAKAALQKFRDERVEHVRTVLEHTEKCQRWWPDYVRYGYDLQGERIQRQYDVLVDRFRELGYEDQDIKSIQQMSESQSDRVVTDRVWKNIRPALQTRIDTTMCVRLEREQAPIINSRKRLVKNAFDDYKRTLRPIEWIHLPPPGLIYAMPAFRSLIYKDLDVPLEQATCDEVARCLPEDIAAFNDKLKDRLLYSMAEDGAFGETARKAKRPPSGIDKEGCLALATSVFAYRTSGVNLALISYEDVAAHLAWTGTQPQSHGIDFYIQMADTQGKSRWVSTYYYLRSGPSTITSLIEALSLDPETTRPQDLDSLDRRFLCEGCNFLNLTYSWRTCISHHYSAHLWRAPDFTALNEKNSAILRQKEGTDPASDQEMWSCNHCTIHLNDLQTHAVVLKHVQETHAINDPEENVDLFHAYPTARLRPTPQQFLTADPLQQHLAADSA